MKTSNDQSIEESKDCFVSWIVTEEPHRDLHEKDIGYLVEDKSFQ